MGLRFCLICKNTETCKCGGESANIDQINHNWHLAVKITIMIMGKTSLTPSIFLATSMKMLYLSAISYVYKD